MNELTVVDRGMEWQRMKSLVLDSVSSPITKRVYNMALNEFFAWYGQEPRPGFTKATVSAWRVTLEERRLGSSSIIVRMSAIRKLAVEATDNGLLAPELAAGIQRVKSAKSIGVRMGNWLSQKQAQTLLNTPDITTLKGLRDRAIIAVLLGCGLRRSGLQPVDAMGVQVELDEVRTAKISKKRPGRGSQDGRELRQRHRLQSTQELKCRTPHSGDLAKRPPR
jgi:site-specific recombinase XerC